MGILACFLYTIRDDYYLERRTIENPRPCSEPVLVLLFAFYKTQFQCCRRVAAGYTPRIPWISCGSLVIKVANPEL